MPHSLGQVYVHLVISTRHRMPLLVDRRLRRDLYGYMTGILRNLGCPSLRIGGVEDHVHLLFKLSRVRPIIQVAEQVKRGSSNWIRDRGREGFDWGDDYDAFSVSPQLVDRVIRYIDNQEEFHRRHAFADEYRGMLRQSGGLRRRVDIHLVFSTKNRFPFLIDDDLRCRLYRRLEAVCATMGCPSVQVGGIEDHVHMLYRLSPEQTLARLAQEIKKRSSRWLATQIGNFDWQEGYGAFSVSPRHVDWVIRYIENQEQHHRQETSAEEYERISQALRPRPEGNV